MRPLWKKNLIVIIIVSYSLCFVKIFITEHVVHETNYEFVFGLIDMV